MPGFTMMPAARGLSEQGGSGPKMVASYIAGLQRKSLERELAALRQEFATQQQQQQQQQAASEEQHLAAIAAKVAELEAAAAAAGREERRLQASEARNRDLQEQLEQQQAASQERFRAAVAVKDARIQECKAAAEQAALREKAAEAAAADMGKQLQAAKAAEALSQQLLQTATIELGNMGQQLAAAKAAAAEKQQQLAAAEAHMQGLQQQFEGQQGVLTEAARTKSALAKALKDLDSAKAAHKQVSATLREAIGQKVSVKREATEAITALEAQLASLQQAAQKRDFARLECIKVLREDVCDLQEEVCDLQQDNEQLYARVLELEQAVGLQGDPAAIQRLMAENRELRVTIAKLQEQVKDSTSDVTRSFGLAPVWETAADWEGCVERREKIVKFLNVEKVATLRNAAPGTPGMLLLEADVLGLPVEAIKQLYLALSRVCHPDKGGSHAAMLGVGEAWQAIQQGFN